VVVDYVGSTEQSAGEMVSNAVPDRSVVRIDVVADLSRIRVPVPLTALARAYAQLLMSSPPPSAVIGYCSAAGLAIQISAELAQHHISTAVGLTVPSFPTRTTVLTELAEVRATLGSSNAAEEVVLPSATDEAAWSLHDVIAADLAAAISTQGLSEAARGIMLEELSSRYDAWLWFLLATSDARVAPRDDLWVVTTDSQAGGPTVGWPAGARVERITVSDNEFLASAAAQDAVALLLAEPG
jgi:hypothetical protein